MAALDVIDEAASRLEDAVLNLDQLVQSWVDLTDVDGKLPAWLFLLMEQKKQVHEATQAHLAAVHQHARPVLKDLAQTRL